MKTKQPLVNPANLARILRSVFQAQARELLSRLTENTIDQGIDLSHWTPSLAASVQPHLLDAAQRGVVGMAERLKLVHRKPRVQTTYAGSPFAPATKGVMNERVSVRSYGNVGRNRFGRVAVLPVRDLCVVAKALGTDFGVFNPKVLDAVDAAALQFCRDTNATATDELTKVIQALRKLLKRGLSKGEAVALLAQKIRKLFNDPYRAHRIAQTETFRALHAGELITAKASGVVEKKSWVASSDACEECYKLDGKEVDLDEPFFIHPKGGPYAIVLYPPFHPWCQCSWSPVL